MVVRSARFNIYLLCLALLASAGACRSPEKKKEKQLAVIRLHLEAAPDGVGLSESVPISRANPILVNVDRGPILRESEVAEARVIEESLGGFLMQIRFNLRGTWLLEQYTATNPRKRLAIYAEFGEKLAEHRWLAAPMIARRIADGVLTFTPDATREEAEQIAHGLNNVAIKEGNQDKPKKAKSKAK